MLIIGFIVGLFVNSQLYLPLIYGLPKSIYYFIKGEVKFMAIITQFTTPLLWTVGLIIVGIILEFISPTINDFLFNRSAFSAGVTLSFFAILLNFLSVSGRVSMKADYDQSTYEKYKKTKDAK